MSSTIYLHFYLNLGNYIDSLKKIATAKDGLSDIGYRWWMTDESGMVNDTYLQKYSEQLRGLSLQQAQFTLSTTALSSAQKEQVLIESGLIASKDKIKASLVESALAQNIDSEATQKAILENLKLTQANSVLIASDKECTEADLRRVLTEANIIGIEQERIVTATGVATAQTGEITSTNLLSLAVEMLYLVTMNIIKKWTGQRQNWGQIHSQLEIYFEERLIGRNL